jgi:bacteriochlorophyllide a dehydrogenase
MSSAQAIVFETPKKLSVQTLELKPVEAGDLVVDVSFSGISTGTERLLWDGSMPPFPGLGYPLVPGYETVGTVVQAAEAGAPGGPGVPVGSQVFVPGSYSFQGVKNIFGGAGSRLVVPQDRVVAVAPELGPQAVLLALAATCYHAIAMGGTREPMVPPDLIVGHGVMGRLLARICLALGWPAPTVWETQPVRREAAVGYACIAPADDTRKDYRSIVDVSGDGSILNQLIMRLAPGGEVVLAGFYKQDLSFAFAPAFMREATLRIAAQWKKHDLLAVTTLVEQGRLSLDGLITHTLKPGQAQQAYEVAFGDPQCLKMMLDWRG